MNALTCCFDLCTAVASCADVHPDVQGAHQPRGEGFCPGSSDQPTWANAFLSWTLWLLVHVSGVDCSSDCSAALYEPRDLSSPEATGPGAGQHASMCPCTVKFVYSLCRHLLFIASICLRQAAFLPTMPEDMLAVAQRAIGQVTWFCK